MSQDMELFFNTAIDLTKLAGKIIREALKKKKNVQTKTSAVDLVTETDSEVENLLISKLKEKFPSHKFIGEESVSAGERCLLTDDPTWIIDPVDGTMNFVHGFPYVAVSIALLIKKETQIGIVYNACLDQMYTAKLGGGAFLNGERIHVSGQEDLSQSLVFAEVGSSRVPEKMDCVFSNLHNVIPRVQGLRSMGSAALNMANVAKGAGDVYYEFGIHAWDIAAGDLLIREAGGVVVDTFGGPLDLMARRVLCASSATLVQQMSKILTQYQPPRD